MSSVEIRNDWRILGAFYCRAARMRACMIVCVITKFLFFACVSKHQSGQSIARSVNSSVKITKAAKWPQIEDSPGFGLVDVYRDQRSECSHSGHCQRGMLCNGIGRLRAAAQTARRYAQRSLQTGRSHKR